ncbi:response regulator transcription factor [Dyadobacter sp. 676]|uniref:Response regulator transcription factor n=1 Tax=Dyadobacter sp. 676 TaxID=3088362 RepID=A0AAU8FHH4_9BACT
MNFLIIDDQPLICIGLRGLLESHFADCYVQEAASVTAALRPVDQPPFDFIIIEPDNGHDIGTKVVGVIKYKWPECAVIIYSRLEENTFAVPFMEAGANAFISKQAGPDQILKAVQTVKERGRYLSVDLLGKLIPKIQASKYPSISKLTTRELMVMQLLMRGKSTKEMAYDLGVRENTVSTFKQRLYRKLKVTNQIELYRVGAIYGM